MRNVESTWPGKIRFVRASLRYFEVGAHRASLYLTAQRLLTILPEGLLQRKESHDDSQWALHPGSDAVSRSVLRRHCSSHVSWRRAGHAGRVRFVAGSCREYPRTKSIHFLVICLAQELPHRLDVAGV